jgi:hypothetical protein
VKTPPLWNLLKRDPLWHDGRLLGGTTESRIASAIALHSSLNSQGNESFGLYNALKQPEKAQLLAFLMSLGRREFQMDETDNLDIISMEDFLMVADCAAGGPYTADHNCAISDIDQDGDVDVDDLASFMLVYVGPRRDCNGNGLVDLHDIVAGTSTDANSNGIPDSCEPTCNADTNGSGTIDVTDLLAVIAQWGECPSTPAPCGADLNVDEVVNVSDLLAIISAWGPCQ